MIFYIDFYLFFAHLIPSSIVDVVLTYYGEIFIKTFSGKIKTVLFGYPNKLA
ncbi:hypothetical protein C427_1230 [Paraglaciecola psychrophila 170]|uniref:Uncharacterized protein n=1 Tax=Paraglaciecola psychrophila 170 TaxID=1129794 RepID=M4RME9_9ALTE|nr:hypothetical protein C427_1230 [Paraglaciecola psychrophila 170]